jgi:hypothetical protein
VLGEIARDEIGKSIETHPLDRQLVEEAPEFARELQSLRR